MSSSIVDELGITRALRRISHEIIEKNESDENLCIIGIKSRGVYLGKIITENLTQLGAKVEFGILDSTPYRDDIGQDQKMIQSSETKINFDVTGKIVVLVDDVIFTGRTARAALEAILDLGRPSKIQLAVLVDRGHRELPIRPDFIGKNIPTSKNEQVQVSVAPFDEITDVKIIKLEN